MFLVGGSVEQASHSLHSMGRWRSGRAAVPFGDVEWPHWLATLPASRPRSHHPTTPQPRTGPALPTLYPQTGGLWPLAARTAHNGGRTAVRRRNSPQPHHRGQLRPSATHWYQCLGSPPHRSVIARVVTHHTPTITHTIIPTLSDKILWFSEPLNQYVWPALCIVKVNPRPKA